MFMEWNLKSSREKCWNAILIATFVIFLLSCEQQQSNFDANRIQFGVLTRVATMPARKTSTRNYLVRFSIFVVPLKSERISLKSRDELKLLMKFKLRMARKEIEKKLEFIFESFKISCRFDFSTFRICGLFSFVKRLSIAKLHTI